MIERNNLINLVLENAQLSNEQIDDVLNSDDTLNFSNINELSEIKNHLYKCKNNNEKILIVGDYDCDGICSTVIMKRVLDYLEIENGFYIPNRIKEGYGLNCDIVNQAHLKGYTTIITVDNGVSCLKEIELAHSLNMFVIICDHHQIKEQLNWDILLHPTVFEDEFKDMCGAGVALQLSNFIMGEDKFQTIMACVATIADMVPVFFENRRIIKRGLSYLNMRDFRHLELLLDKEITNWDETVVSYNIAPKLNAVGRLADLANVNNVVRYFLSNKQSDITTFSAQIKKINQTRKQMTTDFSLIALNKVDDSDFLIIEDESFHEGILGIIANNLVNITHKPCAIFTKNSNVYKGSVRSIPGLDIFDFFSSLQEYLVEFGGHKMACGMSVSIEKFDEFRLKVLEKIKDVKISEVEDNYILIESDLLDIDEIESMSSLKPFGVGFETPVFCVTDFEIESNSIIKDKYPKWQLKSTKGGFEAISFNVDISKINDDISGFIGDITINKFRTTKKISILVKDIVVF